MISRQILLIFYPLSTKQAKIRFLLLMNYVAWHGKNRKNRIKWLIFQYHNYGENQLKTNYLNDI